MNWLKLAEAMRHEVKERFEARMSASNFLAYVDFVKNRIAPNPENVNQMGLTLGLGGEAGEALEAVLNAIVVGGRIQDYVKKSHLHHAPDEKVIKPLRKELGDWIWYWVAICLKFGFNPQEIIAENIEKLEARKKDPAYAAANPNVPTEVTCHYGGGPHDDSCPPTRSKTHAFELDSTTSGLSERFQKCGRCTLPRSADVHTPERAPRPEPWCGACGDSGRVCDEVCRNCSEVRTAAKATALDPSLQEPLFDPHK